MEKKISVAVVDDQRLTRMYVDLFVRSSTRYELAASIPYAEDALEWCRQNKPDLVVMDVMMARGMDGNRHDILGGGEFAYGNVLKELYIYGAPSGGTRSRPEIPSST